MEQQAEVPCLEPDRCISQGVPGIRKAAWIAQQARNFCMYPDDAGSTCKQLIHDRDPCFTAMDSMLKTAGMEIVKTPPRSPQCNTFAERFVREVRETLDNLVIFEQPFFRHVLRNIEKHHHEMRRHQGIGNSIPQGFDYPDAASKEKREVVCDELPGGLLRHYNLKKAA